jgi:hypothetical protein
MIVSIFLSSLTRSPYFESFFLRPKSSSKTSLFSCLRKSSDCRRSPYIAEKE